MIELHRRSVVRERPHDHALQPAVVEILACCGKQTAAEPEALELRPQINFVDLAVIKQAARAVASVICVARNPVAKLENGDAAAFTDSRLPPVRTAPVDQLFELIARDDTLIGRAPRLVVRLGNVRSIDGLRAANLNKGRRHCAIEATNFAPFKPYR